MDQFLSCVCVSVCYCACVFNKKTSYLTGVCEVRMGSAKTFSHFEKLNTFIKQCAFVLGIVWYVFMCLCNVYSSSKRIWLGSSCACVSLYAVRCFCLCDYVLACVCVFVCLQSKSIWPGCWCVCVSLYAVRSARSSINRDSKKEPGTEITRPTTLALHYWHIAYCSTVSERTVLHIQLWE